MFKYLGNKLERTYQKFLNDLSHQDGFLDRKSFLSKIIDDDKFNKSYGKNITRLMTIDERLKIAYTDEEERMQTFMFMGTRHTKFLLKKLKIPRRKIHLSEKEINIFLNKENKKIL